MNEFTAPLVTLDKVEVEVKRTIKLGDRYHISPSMGLAGIEDGIIEVVSITPSEVAKHLPGIQDDKQECWATGDAEYDQMLEECIWVEYLYITGGAEGEHYYLPLPEFIDHISTL